MLPRLCLCISLAVLAGCGAERQAASQESLAYTPYVAEGPATITLITSINGRSNSGAHSALVINGSERVLYDPAGSWALMDGMAPERDDMHFGMFPAALDNYIAFQSNGIFYATEQTIVVPLAVADQAIAAAKAQGSTPKALCGNSVSTVLSKLPGFESLSVAYLPKAISREFAKLPGVVETRIEGTVAE
jgi:hypothetical protein